MQLLELFENVKQKQPSRYTEQAGRWNSLGGKNSLHAGRLKQLLGGGSSLQGGAKSLGSGKSLTE